MTPSLPFGIERERITSRRHHGTDPTPARGGKEGGADTRSAASTAKGS